MEIEDKKHFGSTDPVESVGSSGIPFVEAPLKVYKKLVEYFVSKGYKRGEDFRAAPYDWRYASGNIIITCTICTILFLLFHTSYTLACVSHFSSL